MRADSVSMPTLTASRKCYSKQIMLNSVSQSLVPSGWSRALTQAQHSHRCSFFSVHHWYLLSLTSSQCCLRASHQRGKEASLTGELAPAVLCLLFTCLLMGWCKGKEWRHSRNPMKRVESHSWSCFSSQPKLWLLFHFQFLLAYAYVVRYTVQIKVRYLKKYSVFLYETAYMFLWSGSYFVYSVMNTFLATLYQEYQYS